MNKISKMAVGLLLFLFSCGQVYQNYHSETFSALNWDPGVEIEFSPNIKDNSVNYDVSIGIRHILGFNTNTLNLQVRVVSPSGEERIFPYAFEIKNEDGDYYSECMGDMCDLETVMQESVKFEETGVYKYYISHTLTDAKVLGIMELGLIVSKK